MNPFSRIISGTMTWGAWGAQMSPLEMQQQIERYYALGITTFDHADIYGGYTTEAEFGAAFRKTKIVRDQVQFITKCGIQMPCEARPLPIKHYDYSAKHIQRSVENSLKVLQTDYLDLYQLHWPSRGVNCFGVRDYPYQTATKEAENHLEILETLDAFVKAGTIKAIGLSNETPWGTMKYLQTAKDHNLVRPVTIQNSYSMIHRGYEVGLSEVSK